VLLKTVAHSLKILHDLHIVHSDLKPSNVMIKRTELGYTTKLIDFDSSYVVGSPPPPEEIVGTMNYYSPELVTYIQSGVGAERLTQASDIFALGLIYAEYLTGTMPAFDAAYHEAAIAVLHGAVLRLAPGRTPAQVVELVEQMLLADPAARPTVGEVHGRLMAFRAGTPTLGRAPAPVRLPVRDPATGSPAAHAAPSPPRSTALRGKGLRLVSGIASRAPIGDRRLAAVNPASEGGATPAPSTPRGRALMGKLLGRREGDGPR
jgi:serine/threonine protein kinase